MSTDTDPVAARLTEIRYDWDHSDGRPMRHIPALLGAVEAVLARHQPGHVMIAGALCARHAACRHFSITRTEAAGIQECPDCMGTVFTTCTGCGAGSAFDRCPDRRAISAALTGTESTDA